MRKGLLFHIVCLAVLLFAPVVGIIAQTFTTDYGTYKLNYTASGNNVTVTGGTFTPSFDGALDIPAMVVNAGTTYKVKIIAPSAFLNKAVITSVTLHEGLDSIGSRAFRYAATDGTMGKIAGKITIPSTVTKLGFRAFEGHKGITTIEFTPTSQLTSLGDNVFLGTSITSIALPNSLKIIPREALADLPNLVNVTLPDAYTSIGQKAFYNCGISGDIVFPNTLTTLGVSCFSTTRNLKTATFLTGSPVTEIPNNAFYMSSLQNVSLPAGLLKIGDNAYSKCTNMGGFDLELPATLQTIGSAAFALWRKKNDTPEFTNRNKLIFPANSALTSIGHSAFRNGKWYGDINLPAGITKIDSLTFTRNEQWEGHITLPEGLTEIGKNAFELVGSTQDLLIPAKVINIYDEAFYNSPFSGISFAPGSQLNFLGKSAFKFCFNLSYLDLSNVTNIHATNASRAADVNNTSQYAFMPPYTMVYLPTNSTVKAGEVNFVVNGQCDYFVVHDQDTEGRYYSIKDRTYPGNRLWLGQERRATPNAPTPENVGLNRGNDYIIQHEFTAKKATYTSRTFAKTLDKTYTVCLPYDATVPAGMRAYTLNQRIDTGFQFLSIPDGQKLKAYQPYVLRVVDPNKSVSFIDDTNDGNGVLVKKTADAVLTQTVPTKDQLQFIGTTVNILNADARNKNYHNLSGGIWYPVKTLVDTWTTPNLAADKANGFGGFIHSMRAYVVTPTAGAAKFLMMFEDIEEALTTDVRSVEKSVNEGIARIYSTDGNYLGLDFDSLPSGRIYIIGGKKVYKF